MHLPDIPNERVTLLLGAPRSGTTWLGKIFDSHPDVLYRHEPDTVLRNDDIPRICPTEHVHLHAPQARDYLRQLMEVRTLKSAGSLPTFPKSFENRASRATRHAMIYGLRVAEQLPPATRAARRVAIPDMISVRSHDRLRVVMKSVSSRGRLRLFAEALPGCRIVFLLRNPCGQVASMLRGTALGKFESRLPLHELVATPEAARYGLTIERLEAMTPVEQFAWHWAVLNEKALSDLEGLPNARMLRYGSLTSDPAGQAQDLFAFAGLSWHQQSAAFIAASTQPQRRDRYYQVFKDTAHAANKWRAALGRDDLTRVAEVVRTTPLWPLYPELQEFAA